LIRSITIENEHSTKFVINDTADKVQLQFLKKSLENDWIIHDVKCLSVSELIDIDCLIYTNFGCCGQKQLYIGYR